MITDKHYYTIGVNRLPGYLAVVAATSRREAEEVGDEFFKEKVVAGSLIFDLKKFPLPEIIKDGSRIGMVNYYRCKRCDSKRVYFKCHICGDLCKPKMLKRAEVLVDVIIAMNRERFQTSGKSISRAEHQRLCLQRLKEEQEERRKRGY